jgi:hypothetical protein
MGTPEPIERIQRPEGEYAIWHGSTLGERTPFVVTRNAPPERPRDGMIGGTRTLNEARSWFTARRANRKGG